MPKGDDEKLKWFESSIDIKNTLIEVSSIEKAYFPAGDEFSKFVKVVDDDETDARLDKGVDVMNKMLVGINDINKTLINMNSNLSRRMDNLGEKVDTIGEKIDNLGEKVDTIGEKIDRIDGKMGSMLQKQDDLIVVGQRHEFQPE